MTTGASRSAVDTEVYWRIKAWHLATKGRELDDQGVEAFLQLAKCFGLDPAMDAIQEVWLEICKGAAALRAAQGE